MPGNDEPEGQDYLLREPCKVCGLTEGRIHWNRGGQDIVYCKNGHHCYNAPKTETGRVPRTLSSIRNIAPSKRARLLERANNRCELCGSPDNLVIAHIVSVKDAFDRLTDAELNSDENLMVQCAECNAGWSARSLPLRFLAKVLWQRTQPPPSDRKPALQELGAWLERVRGKLITDEDLEHAQTLIAQVVIEAKREVEDEHKRKDLEAWRKKRREEDQ